MGHGAGARSLTGRLRRTRGARSPRAAGPAAGRTLSSKQKNGIEGEVLPTWYKYHGTKCVQGMAPSLRQPSQPNAPLPSHLNPRGRERGEKARRGVGVPARPGVLPSGRRHFRVAEEKKGKRRGAERRPSTGLPLTLSGLRRSPLVKRRDERGALPDQPRQTPFCRDLRGRPPGRRAGRAASCGEGAGGSCTELRAFECAHGGLARCIRRSGPARRATTPSGVARTAPASSLPGKWKWTWAGRTEACVDGAATARPEQWSRPPSWRGARERPAPLVRSWRAVARRAGGQGVCSDGRTGGPGPPAA